MSGIASMSEPFHRVLNSTKLVMQAFLTHAHNICIYTYLYHCISPVVSEMLQENRAFPQMAVRYCENAEHFQQKHCDSQAVYSGMQY